MEWRKKRKLDMEKKWWFSKQESSFPNDFQVNHVKLQGCSPATTTSPPNSPSAIEKCCLTQLRIGTDLTHQIFPLFLSCPNAPNLVHGTLQGKERYISHPKGQKKSSSKVIFGWEYVSSQEGKCLTCTINLRQMVGKYFSSSWWFSSHFKHMLIKLEHCPQVVFSCIACSPKI